MASLGFWGHVGCDGSFPNRRCATFSSLATFSSATGAHAGEMGKSRWLWCGLTVEGSQSSKGQSECQTSSYKCGCAHVATPLSFLAMFVLISFCKQAEQRVSLLGYKRAFGV